MLTANRMRQELADMIAFLAETPEAVRRLREGLEGGELRARADDGSFSFVEHVCHLRDIEREGYGSRIEKIFSEELPALEDLDGAALARERLYNEQEFESGLEDFSRSREWNLFVLRGVSAEQLERRGGVRGGGGKTPPPPPP